MVFSTPFEPTWSQFCLSFTNTNRSEQWKRSKGRKGDVISEPESPLKSSLIGACRVTSFPSLTSVPVVSAWGSVHYSRNDVQRVGGEISR